MMVFKVDNFVAREHIVAKFLELGFIIKDEKFNKIYFEKGCHLGYLEIALQNAGVFYLRIAKPNHVDILNCLMNDLNRFKLSIPIDGINLQTKEKINFIDYVGLKEHYKKSQEEYVKWYPDIPYPVRCDDIPKYRQLHF